MLCTSSNWHSGIWSTSRRRPMRRARRASTSHNLKRCGLREHRGRLIFELEPGDHTGMHTDSAEEVVPHPLGHRGGDRCGERGELTAGGIGLVPALVPHDVRNVGEETVRVVGFFSSSTVVSVFDDPLAPAGTRVVGTPFPEESDVAPQAVAR